MRLAAVGAAVLLLANASAWADVVVADGDGLAPVTANGVDFGNVCIGSTVTKPALIAIRRQGSGAQVFNNSTVVTVAVASAPGGALSTAPATGTIGTVALPSDWSTQSNGALSPLLGLPVTINAAASGAVTGTVGLSATGGGVTRTGSLVVSANVVSCDTTPPLLALPASITAEAVDAAGAPVSYTASASDLNPASPEVSCAPASGGIFPIGTTTVHCSATDTAGNPATGSFTVKVKDSTGPVIGDTVDLTDVEATSRRRRTAARPSPTPHRPPPTRSTGRWT